MCQIGCGFAGFLTNHHSGRHRIPFQPERDERRCDQNDARNKDGGKVESAIARKHQVHLQATVVSCWRSHIHHTSTYIYIFVLCQ